MRIQTRPQLSLAGESSSIRFGVEPQFFDLGLTPYDRPVERDLHIANTGVHAHTRMQAACMHGQLACGGLGARQQPAAHNLAKCLQLSKHPPSYSRRQGGV